MSKKILVIILVIAVAGLAYFKLKPQAKEEVAEARAGTVETPVRSAPPQKPQPGDKLADLPVSQFAFQVAPGDLTPAASTALIGWDIKSTGKPDGSIDVALTPNKADDQKKTYSVPAGDSLYFVEMSAGDDDATSGVDSRLQDDYGVLVNAAGIVQ